MPPVRTSVQPLEEERETQLLWCKPSEGCQRRQFQRLWPTKDQDELSNFQKQNWYLSGGWCFSKGIGKESLKSYAQESLGTKPLWI